MKLRNLAIALGSMSVLAGCGGGGGGPGGTSIDISPVRSIGSVSMPIASDGFIAAIRTVSEDGKADAKEAIAVFQWMNNNANLDTSFMNSYEVDIEGVTYNLQDAYNLLLGYKKAYYDGKESFWQDVINTGEYDDTDSTFAEIKILGANLDQDRLLEIGKGTKTVDDVKAEIIEEVLNNENDQPIDENPVEDDPVEQPVDEVEEIIEDQPVVEDPVDESDENTEDTEEETPTEQEEEPTPVEDTPVEEETVTVVDTTTTTEMISRTITNVIYGDWQQTVYDVKEETLGDFTIEYTKYRKQRSVTNVLVTVYEDTTVVTYSNSTTETTSEQRTETSESIESPEVTYTDWIETGRNGVEEELTNPGEANENAVVEYADVTYTDSNLGTVTPGAIKDPNDYRTDEFFGIAAHANDDSLNEIKADAAWSRGWTGNNVKIVIADSGARITHEDLDNNVIATKNFFDGTDDVTDLNGHGTHVAGIAAAELNGTGMIGVAPDAKLMIAKVAYDNGNVSFSYARQAAAWGRDAGAVAINLSAEQRLDNAFRTALVENGEGEWYSTHWYYGINGYNGAKSSATYWKQALGSDMVLVKAAGNAGLAYSAGANQMATATDANGNLIMDGQMIIVGNWDIGNQRLGGGSNAAGNVCTTYTDGACQDAAKIKDFFIMAPGTSVYSTVATGDSNYNHMTGTSMAAPAVTGALAVVHQMWPHMKGKYLVQLLLETADKDMSGYDENVHGQGLLDLDAATQPVGATGIPTTGRTSGGIASLSGGIAGNIDLGNVASSTMVLDSYERDFYVDLSTATAKVDTRKTSFIKNINDDVFTGSFASLAGAVKEALGTVYAGQNQDNFAFGQQFGNYELGFVTEKGTMLGNQFSGVFGIADQSRTVYGAYNASKTAFGLDFVGRAELGYTMNDADAQASLVKDVNNVTSIALHSGVFKNINNWKFGATASVPTRIIAGEMVLDVPVARTLDGQVITEQQTAKLSTGLTEVDYGLSANYTTEQQTFGAYIEERVNYAGTQNNVTEYGIKYEFKF